MSLIFLLKGCIGRANTVQDLAPCRYCVSLMEMDSLTPRCFRAGGLTKGKLGPDICRNTYQLNSSEKAQIC